MGITLRSKNCSVDMGYGGFGLFRDKVALLANATFGMHYATLNTDPARYGSTRDAFFDRFNATTEQMVNDGLIAVEIADFLFQPDVDGKITRKQARMIYEVLKDHEDRTVYGYAAQPDRATFYTIREVFKDCVDNGGTIRWR